MYAIRSYYASVERTQCAEIDITRAEQIERQIAGFQLHRKGRALAVEIGRHLAGELDRPEAAFQVLDPHPRAVAAYPRGQVEAADVAPFGDLPAEARRQPGEVSYNFV